jgi:hypothetical protein
MCIGTSPHTPSDASTDEGSSDGTRIIDMFSLQASSACLRRSTTVLTGGLSTAVVISLYTLQQTEDERSATVISTKRREMHHDEVTVAQLMAIVGQGLSCPAGYLSFGPIEKHYVFCDLSVREKDWRSRARGAQAT